MKILFLSAWYPQPADNGSKIRVYHLIDALARAHEVVLASFAWGTAAPDEADDVHHMCCSVHLLHLNPILQAHMGTLRTFLSLTPSAARSMPAMHELVRKISSANRFDAVIASTTTMSAYALDVPAPRIIEEHNALSRWMYERYRAQTAAVQRVRCWASWRKARRFEAQLYRQFDLVTVVSEQDRQALQSVLGRDAGRLAVVPNGTDTQRNRPNLAQPVPDHLVFNGALSYAANFDAMRWFLAQIFPIIQRHRPAATLSITGSTAGVDLGSLPLGNGVRLTGFVDDIRPVVAGATACIAPIREGGGSRLKILEAMALGTPVVATTKAAEGLDVTPGEHLLVADKPEDFARCTVTLLSDADLRRRLAAQGRRLVEARYDWTTIGSHFEEMVLQTTRPTTAGKS